jgi:hypothetical protein
MDNDSSFVHTNKKNVSSFGYIFDKCTVYRISFYLM